MISTISVVDHQFVTVFSTAALAIAYTELTALRDEDGSSLSKRSRLP